jgi:phage-related protein (TIGR01555 family)
LIDLGLRKKFVDSLKVFVGHKIATDATETISIRGAGAHSQAVFGATINDADLLFAVKREPVAHRIVFMVAHDIFDNWFSVNVVGEKPDTRFNDQIQAVLEDENFNAKAVFTEMAVYERLFGEAIIVVGFSDYGKDLSKPVKDPQSIEDIVAYSPLEFTVQSSDEDKDHKSPRFGFPEFYTLYQGSQSIRVHYSRVIHFATRLLDHPYRGLSVLEPVYDDLTVLRNIRWGLGQTIVRYGSGFPDITLKGRNSEQIDDFILSKQMETVNARTYFVHTDNELLDFKGVGGVTLDPEKYYVPIMESISAGSGIPMAILRGAQAGALTGSEVNEREYFKIVSDAQSRYEPGVRALIDILIECGQIRWFYNVPKKYRISWGGGFEVNEKDRAATQLSIAQAMSVRSNWMTLNEIRASMDPPLESLPGPQGEIVLGLEKLQSQKLMSPA